jgi:hypothetical protein
VETVNGAEGVFKGRKMPLQDGAFLQINLKLNRNGGLNITYEKGVLGVIGSGNGASA